MFGAAPSIASTWVEYGMVLLLKVLMERIVLELRVKWSNKNDIHEFYDKVKLYRKRGHPPPNKFGVIAGGRMPCVTHKYGSLQIAFYNG